MIRIARYLAAVAAACAVTAAAAGTAHAQSFPSKPVRIIVPFPPGGPGDLVSRTLGQKLSEQWGQPVVIENRPGGNTLIGVEAVRQAPADGYTLLMAIDSTVTMNQHMYSRLPYDPEKDLMPVSLSAVVPLMVVINGQLPYKSIAEFVAAARAEPGKLTMGAGSVTTQLAVEIFKSMAGIDLLYVPYKGSAPTVQALLGGEISSTIDGISTSLPHIRAGRLRGLGVTTKERVQALPEFPTVHESGVAGYEFVPWFGLMARTGTPRAIVDQISADVRKALETTELREKLMAAGIVAQGSTPVEMTDRIRREAAQWAEPIRKAGIKVD